MIKTLIQRLQDVSDPEKAKIQQGFFKTGKGQYGYGDKFLGITVPMQRNICKDYLNLNFEEIDELLESDIHEHRFCALTIIVGKYKKGNEVQKKEIYDFYMLKAKRINNWDLVDTSAPYIPGEYLIDKDKSVLYKFVRSANLWEKRISIVSTFGFIRAGIYDDTLKISEILLNDSHDLIHKASGWMLREMGKRSQSHLLSFLDRYAGIMPRTMLRYSIEKLSDVQKRYYMGK